MTPTLSRKRRRKQYRQAFGRKWREAQDHFRLLCCLDRLAYKLNERIECQTPPPQHLTTYDSHPNT